MRSIHEAVPIDDEGWDERVSIHPSAIVETGEVGPGTRIWAFTHVMEGVRLGADCNIGGQCYLETGVVVGDNVTIKNNNSLWNGVILGDGVFVGPGVLFTNDLYPRSPRLHQALKRYRDRCWLISTRVERGASLGAGAIILAGATIGEYSMVGAGAVVTRDVAPYSLVFGNPARRKGWICQCGTVLRFGGKKSICGACGLLFAKERGLLKPVGNTVEGVSPMPRQGCMRESEDR